MSQTTLNDRSAQLDQYLQNQVKKTGSQVKMIDLFTHSMILLCGIVGGLFLLAVVDAWIIELGGIARWGALILFVGGGLIYFAFHIVPLLIRKINPIYAAKVVESAQPELNNSLINYLLLRKQETKVSKRVVDIVGTQAAQGISGLPVENSVDKSDTIRVALLLAGIVIALAAYKVMSPKDPFQTFARVFAPASDISKPSRARIINVTPGSKEVFFGQQVEVTAEITGNFDPAEARLEYSTQDGQIVNGVIRMEESDKRDVYRCILKTSDRGLEQAVNYRVLAGDAVSNDFAITLKVTPILTVESITYFPPEYTERPEQTVAGVTAITALEGTEVEIQALANADIEIAYIELLNESKDGSEYTVANTVSMKSDDPRRATGKFKVQMDPRRERQKYTHYRLQLVTTDDGRSEPDGIFPLRVIRDEAPEIEVVNPTQTTLTVPVNSRIKFDIQAMDPDFKLTEIQVGADNNGIRRFDEGLDFKGQDPSGQVTTSFELWPKERGFRVGDEVILAFAAADNRHSALSNRLSPNVSLTPTITVKIVDPINDPPKKQPEKKEQPKQDQKSGEDEKDEKKEGQQKDDQGEEGQNEKSENQDQNKKGSDDRDKKEKDPNADKPESSSKGDDDPKSDTEQEGGTDKGEQNDRTGSKDDRSEKDGEEGEQSKDGSDTKDGNTGEEGGKEPGSEEGGDPTGEKGKGDRGEERTGEQNDGSESGDSDPNSDQSSQMGNDPNGEKGKQPGDPSANDAGENNDGSDSSNALSEDASTGEVMQEILRHREQKEREKAAGGQDEPKDGSGDEGSDSPKDGSEEKGEQPNEDANGGSEETKESKSPGEAGSKNDKKANSAEKKASGSEESGEESKQGSEGEKQGSENSKGSESSKGGDQKKNSGDQKSGDEKSGDQSTKGGEESQDQKSGQDSKGGEKSPKGGDQKKGDQSKGGQSQDQKSGMDKKGSADKNANDAGKNEKNAGTKGESEEDSKDGGQSGKGESQQKQESGDESESSDGGSGSQKQDDEKQAEEKGGSGGQEQDDKKSGKGGQQDDKSDSKQDGGSDGEKGDSKTGKAGKSGDKGGKKGGPGGESKGKSNEGTKKGSQKGDKGSEKGQKGGTKSDEQSNDDGENTSGGDDKKTGSQSKEGKEGGKPGKSSDGDSDSKSEGSPNAPPSNSKGQDKPNSKSSSTGTKSGNGSNVAGDSKPGSDNSSQPSGEDTAADQANLDFTKKATDLALEHLEDQLIDPDPKLLDNLNMSEEQLRDFVDRWKKLKAAAAQDENSLKDYENALKSLNLGAPDVRNRRFDGESDTLTGNTEDGSISNPPPSFVERFNAFNKRRQQAKRRQ